MTCRYCGGNDYFVNMRGGRECSGCGHPVETIEPDGEKSWWLVMDYQMKTKKTWEEYKREGLQEYVQRRRQRLEGV